MKGVEQQTGSILVVDDASIIRATCQRALERAGYQVKTADSGEDALKTMQKGPAEVILLDIRMPGISGVEVLRNVKKNWPDTEVVIMTAYADQDIAEESIRLGAGEILIKPFDNIQDMTAAVTKAAARARIQKDGTNLDDTTLQTLLTDQGICSQPDVEMARKYAEDNSMSLRKALASLGIIMDDDIDWAASRYMEIPYVRIHKKIMDMELIRKFPVDVARKYKCLPLWRDEENLHLVMADPLVPGDITRIEQRIGMKIKPAKGEESEIDELIQEFYGDENTSQKLETLVKSMKEKTADEKLGAIESILAMIQIQELKEADIYPAGNELYELDIKAIIKTRTGI